MRSTTPRSRRSRGETGAASTASSRRPIAGGDAAQSCDIGDSESGYLQTTVHGPGDLSFYWKVSSEAGADVLSYSIDSTQMDAISGETDWAQVASALGPGTHFVRWTYAKNAGGSAGTDCGWVDDVQFSGAPATLAQALDLGLTAWQTGGDGGWFHQTASYQYDGDAAQSSPLYDGQQTYLQTTVSGPTPLSFYWKVSSEADWDFLHFYIDGELQDSISGEVDWSPRSYSLGFGSHTLRWIYAKDGSASGGSDCGWIDHVVLNPSDSHTLTLTPGGPGTGRVIVGADPIPHGLPYQEAFAVGTEIALEAVPDVGSLFTSWSGDLVSAANPAAVTMDQDKGIVANFELTASPDLTLTAPNGGERWPAGSTRTVTWTQSSLSGDVTIDLYKGGVLSRTLGTASATLGTYSWTIAGDETPGADYRVRVWQGGLSDESDADFEILPGSRRVDFNGDGQEDILWRYQGSGDYQGLNVIWLMNQTGGAAPASLAMEQSIIGERGLAGLTSADRSGPLRPARVQLKSQGAPTTPIKSILRGDIGHVARPKLNVRAPLEAGNRTAPSRHERPKAKDFGNIIVRESAMGPGLQAVNDAKIASLSLGQEVVFSQIPDMGWEIAGTGDFNGDG